MVWAVSVRRPAGRLLTCRCRRDSLPGISWILIKLAMNVYHQSISPEFDTQQNPCIFEFIGHQTPFRYRRDNLSGM